MATNNFWIHLMVGKAAVMTPELVCLGFGATREGYLGPSMGGSGKLAQVNLWDPNHQRVSADISGPCLNKTTKKFGHQGC